MLKIMIMTVLAILLISTISPVISANDAEDNFFGDWVGALDPVVRYITGSDDSADVFHQKLLDAGATLNGGLKYVRDETQTSPNKNLLAWYSLKYMWPFIRIAYPDSDIPTWNDIEGMLDEIGVNEENFYDLFIWQMAEITVIEREAIKQALDDLYDWMKKTPKTDFSTLILLTVIILFSGAVAYTNIESGNFGTIFLVVLCINLMLCAWLNAIPYVLIIVPLLILGIILIKGFLGDGSE